ncbi:MAG: DNA translocase FtsK 4TM domain-containing protein, partial [Alphaproteobacteria bacterium]
MGIVERQTGLSLFPEAFKDAMRRKMRQLVGLGALAAVGLVAIALMTWTAGDPSLSYATNAPVKNWLGKPGAIIADLLMQLLGLGAIVLLAVTATWGWRLMTHRPLDRMGLRTPLWILGGALAAVALSTLPAPSGWPLPTGIGGVIGDRGLSAFTVLLGAMGARSQGLAGALAALIALGPLAIASGLWLNREPIDDEEAPAPRSSYEDRERDDARGGIGGAISNSLGALAHMALATKARFARAVSDAPHHARMAADVRREEPAKAPAAPSRLAARA